MLENNVKEFTELVEFCLEKSYNLKREHEIEFVFLTE